MGGSEFDIMQVYIHLRNTRGEGSYPSWKVFSWVCEEALEGHEWVPELTISMQEEEVLVALN